MPLLQWNDRMSVGIAVFDADHQKLVALLNELFDGIQAGRTKDTLGGVLDQLISYTATHFDREEEYMARYGYPDLAAHRQEHEELKRQALEVQKRYRENATAALGMDVMKFLKDWLVKHIQGSDRRYGVFLNAKGVK